tara:strand:- start:162 stop:278 length:117 start_codon:yes stop_codon:yes gene_type:complete
MECEAYLIALEYLDKAISLSLLSALGANKYGAFQLVIK